MIAYTLYSSTVCRLFSFLIFPLQLLKTSILTPIIRHTARLKGNIFVQYATLTIFAVEKSKVKMMLIYIIKSVLD